MTKLFFKEQESLIVLIVPSLSKLYVYMILVLAIFLVVLEESLCRKGDINCKSGKKQCEMNGKMSISRPAYGKKKLKFSSSNLNFLMRITNPRMLISDKRVAVNQSSHGPYHACEEYKVCSVYNSLGQNLRTAN